jgi:hypothetical protein
MTLTLEPHDVGDRFWTRNVFKNSAGVNTDPTTITCTVTAGDGTESVYTYGDPGGPTREAAGTYYQEFDLTMEGQWYVEWAGTGAVATVAKFTFFVW